MTGMLLMIFGVLTFGAGMYLYKSADKAAQSPVKSPELERAIEMAKADGVLAPNEREIIRQLAVEQGPDAEEILAEVEQEIAEIEDVKSSFAIECKWKKKTLENRVLIARRDELERYKDF